MEIGKNDSSSSAMREWMTFVARMAKMRISVPTSIWQWLHREKLLTAAEPSWILCPMLVQYVRLGNEGRWHLTSLHYALLAAWMAPTS